jgi:hypothetical protein
MFYFSGKYCGVVIMDFLKQGDVQSERKGSIILISLIVIFALTVLGLSISKMIFFNIKGVSREVKEFLHFQGADGGIYAVTGWMYFYKRADVPKEVANTNSYSVEVKLLSNTMRYPAGYSSAWKGFDARLNSSSNSVEIEAVVFVPVAPAGYGNE